MISDRIFGLVVVVVALAYFAGAAHIQTSFLSDPVGPKMFPRLVASVAAICGIVVILRPDQEPEWPSISTLMALGFAIVVLVGYAYALKPLGFLIPTAICAGILSYQISPRALPAALSGAGLSLGLFLLFRYALKLETLKAVPKDWIS